jgi:uncharacterized protein (TIGR01777 family)
MKILLTGSSGLIGSAVGASLAGQGHAILQLTRTPTAAGGTIILWDPSAADILNHSALEGVDAVVHLAGENIARARWSPTQKALIRNSRVHGTALLARTLAGLQSPPAVFISASAVGFYGDRGQEILTEESPPGTGFLASVCEDWEAAAREAAPRIRTVKLRIGFVLSRVGGGLPKMVTPFKLGLGGVIGGGNQYMSWIAIDDLVEIVLFCLHNASMSGPVNAVSPNPVTNREFTRALGRVLSRPTLLPMPAFAARLAMGEMANDLLLASQRIIPAKLQRAGYRFKFPEVEESLRHLLTPHR